MATSNFHARGHSEFGERVGGSDTSWGRTAESGVTFQFSIDRVDLQSAQTLNFIDTGIVGTGMTARAELLNVALQNLNRVLYQPSANFTEPGGATLEQVDITDTSLGAETKELYSLGDGPVGARRIEMPETRLADIGDITQQKREWTRLAIGVSILQPSAGHAVRFRDLP